MKPSKKLILTGVFLLTTLTAGTAGFTAGRFYEILTAEEHRAARDARTAGLSLRTERYLPSCDELRQEGLPRIVPKGDDYFLVLPRKDDVYVMGIGLEPGKPPVSYWWGADLSNELNRCKEK